MMAAVLACRVLAAYTDAAALSADRDVDRRCTAFGYVALDRRERDAAEVGEASPAATPGYAPGAPVSAPPRMATGCRSSDLVGAARRGGGLAVGGAGGELDGMAADAALVLVDVLDAAASRPGGYLRERDRPGLEVQQAEHDRRAARRVGRAQARRWWTRSASRPTTACCSRRCSRRPRCSSTRPPSGRMPPARRLRQPAAPSQVDRHWFLLLVSVLGCVVIGVVDRGSVPVWPQLGGRPGRRGSRP